MHLQTCAGFLLGRTVYVVAPYVVPCCCCAVFAPCTSLTLSSWAAGRLRLSARHGSMQELFCSPICLGACALGFRV